MFDFGHSPVVSVPFYYSTVFCSLPSLFTVMLHFLLLFIGDDKQAGQTFI